MRLGKAVFAKASHLAKHLFGKLLSQPLAEHPFKQLAAKVIDDAGPPPSTHRPSQLIGFSRCKPGCNHGQPHGLLLKQRNA